MKTTRTLLAFLALGPLALANEWAAESLSFAPKAGATLSKHLSIESEMQLDQMSMELDGNDVGDMAGQLELAMKISMTLSVRDQYESAADGRPTKLVRTYDELSSTTHMSMNSPQAGNTENDVPLESELEGAAVEFTWDASDEDYDVAFAGEQDGDEALLEGLTEDMDFRGYLPEGEVKEGDTWKIPSEAVKATLAPGGDLKLMPTGEAASDPMSGSGMDMFSQNDMVGSLEGDFEATYAGTREEDGVKVAVIKLSIEARTAQDMASKLDGMKDQMKQNLPPGVEVDISTMDIEYELEAEGELLWNVETDLVSGLTLSGEMQMIMDMSMDLKMGEEGSRSMDISQTYGGTQTFTLTTGE